MNLIPDQLYFGVAPKILIDCARQLTKHDPPTDIVPRPSISPADFCKALGARASDCLPVLAQMVEEGFFVQAEGTTEAYHSTPKLRQLALANITRGLERVEADVLIKKILSMAESINSDPAKYPYGVACIVVFGSYLGAKQLLGDIDIGVGIFRQGKVEKLDFKGTAERKTFSALQLRKPSQISLHSVEEVLSLNTPYQVIFGKLPPKPNAN